MPTLEVTLHRIHTTASLREAVQASKEVDGLVSCLGVQRYKTLAQHGAFMRMRQEKVCQPQGMRLPAHGCVCAVAREATGRKIKDVPAARRRGACGCSDKRKDRTVHRSLSTRDSADTLASSMLHVTRSLISSQRE